MQHQIASTLISSLRLIVQQRLLPAKSGQGRVAIKEYLVFNATLRKALFNTKIENLISTIEDMVDEHGQPLYADAQKKYDQGLIYKEDLVAIQKEREII
jgi:defect-in-organelle-trafficking protein DotB